jgi:hypothetical protein
VRSDIALPDLAPWQGDDRSPDVIFRLGQAPERPGDPVFVGSFVQAWPDGAHRFYPAHGAVYDIDAQGREVVIDAAEPASADVRVFLLSAVLSALCLKRQLFPLHASAVRIDGVAVAFVGLSGVGKSTIAAALMRQGHSVLADDLTAVEAGAVGGPMVWPTFPYLKLCGDALEHLHLQSIGKAPNKLKLDKHYVSATDRFTRDPVPLRALLHLGWAPDQGIVIERLRGAAAVRAAIHSIYRHRLASHLVPERQLRATINQLCAGVPVHAVTQRPPAVTVEQFLDRIRAELSA